MLFALRSVAHESTGFSPAELVYGRALRSPLRLVRENWEEKGSDPTVVEYVCNLLQRLYDTQALVEANMLEAQTKAKKRYDKNSSVRQFHEGQKVLMLRTSKANKLGRPRYDTTQTFRHNLRC